jgi:hypothetical protein
MIGATILSLYKEPVQLEPYMLLRNLEHEPNIKKMLVCYDFHLGIFDKEQDLMFDTKPKLFSIGTIVVLTSVWSDQPIKFIASTNLNIVEHVKILVEHVLESPISSYIHVEPIFVLHVKIVIPFDNFRQH